MLSGAGLWRPRKRLAAAPGRLARPAPPGHDDPCVARRTIPEGMPRLPREAFERGLRRAVPVDAAGSGGLARRSFSEGGTTASTGPGQKSHVERRKASVPSPGRRDASTQAGFVCPGCAYRTRPRGTCGAQRTQGGLFCSGLSFDEASACRSWHADLGASHASKRQRRSARPSRGGE